MQESTLLFKKEKVGEKSWEGKKNEKQGEKKEKEKKIRQVEGMTALENHRFTTNLVSVHQCVLHLLGKSILLVQPTTADCLCCSGREVLLKKKKNQNGDQP